MRVVVFPEQIDFHSGNPTARIAVTQLTGLDPANGFVRQSQRIWFVVKTGAHQCRLKPGIYEIQTDDGTEFLVLLPQRVGLSVEVARELLRNPFVMPKPAIIPQPMAKAMTDLILHGLSWVAATRAIGLSPYGDVPNKESE